MRNLFIELSKVNHPGWEQSCCVIESSSWKGMGAGILLWKNWKCSAVDEFWTEIVLLQKLPGSLSWAMEEGSTFYWTVKPLPHQKLGSLHLNMSSEVHPKKSWDPEQTCIRIHHPELIKDNFIHKTLKVKSCMNACWNSLKDKVWETTFKQWDTLLGSTLGPAFQAFEKIRGLIWTKTFWAPW